jgi:hypothetical protein
VSAAGSTLLYRERRVGELVEASAIPRRMVVVWAALFLNVLAFSGLPTLLPIPGPIGQLITQGSLPLALVLALVVNTRTVIRPSLVMVLLTLLALTGLMVSIHNEFALGSTFRATRFVGFVAVLWLLTPWWGRHDMLLLRCHRRCIWAVLGTVLVGAILSPGLAFSFDGRLAGVIWPVPSTQVAHYAAILFGTTVVLWMCGVITGGHALLTVALTGTMLVMTHTRTALLAGAVALVIACASLFFGHARARRTSALGAVGVLLAVSVFASELTTWLLRGQTTQEAGQLTGRTKVWTQVFATPRPRMHEIFGSGLSNQSFNGLPIDSNWVATFWDQGWFGLLVDATLFLLLLLMAATRPRGPRRACALFLIVYCLTASFTETGMAIPSAYVLELVLAASLLAPETRRSES